MIAVFSHFITNDGKKKPPIVALLRLFRELLRQRKEKEAAKLARAQKRQQEEQVCTSFALFNILFVFNGRLSTQVFSLCQLALYSIAIQL